MKESTVCFDVRLGEMKHRATPNMNIERSLLTIVPERWPRRDKVFAQALVRPKMEWS